MKAVVWTKYGPPDVLQLREVEKPAPKDNEVLIRVRATTVTAGDCEARGMKFPLWLGLAMRLFVGFIRPTRRTILGQELAGEVEAVGKDVTRFKPGDAVFGSTGFVFGGYAEYVCLPEDSDEGVLVTKPASISYEEAAGIPTGGMESLHFLRLGKLQSGQRLLIVGAGGSIGTFGVQLAKHYGAEVTAIDSGPKLDMLRELGADHVIDYTKEDFTKRGETYDAIFDVIGKSPFSGSLRCLKPGGAYLIANPRFSLFFRGPLTSLTSGKRVVFSAAGRTVADLTHLKELIEAGTIHTVIDKQYPLEQTAEAHRYVETGQKKGNVIITV